MSSSMEPHCLSFRDLPQTTKLFTSYAENFGRVARYYGHPPTAAGVLAASREIALDPATRKGAVEVLREQNRAFGADVAALRNIERLASGAAAIVTGQQVGLFSGPIYSIYKALSAVKWAGAISRRGVEAVPIFWLATEDHDLAEVNESIWNTPQGLKRFELSVPEADTGKRVGEITLGNDVIRVVGSAAGDLAGPFADTIIRALRESYAPTETFGSAFAKLMTRLLKGTGIVFVDPLDARLHRLASGVYRSALEKSDSLRDALAARSTELDRAGFHAQVKVSGETSLLFYNASGKRQPLRIHNGKLSAGNKTFSVGELRSALERAPESFSGNALLRPVVQDTLLPTAAYVGGPAEIAYMAQAQVLYQNILGRMPAILPRMSCTLIESPVARLLKKYGLEVYDIFSGRQSIHAKIAMKSLPRGLRRRFDADENILRRLLKGYAKPLAQLDATLSGARGTVERKILYQFLKLKAKAGRAEGFRNGVLERHERLMLDALYPEKALQERSLCALPFIAALGQGLVDELLEVECRDAVQASAKNSRKGDADSPGPIAFHRLIFL